MTRYRMGLWLLILLAGAGLWTQKRMADIHVPIAAAMRSAADRALLGDWDAAVKYTSRAQAAWMQNRDFTSALADHTPLEDIEAQLSQLPAIAASRNRSGYAALCTTLSQRILAVSDAHRVSVGNIL